jgi:subtilisin family serine protease
MGPLPLLALIAGLASVLPAAEGPDPLLPEQWAIANRGGKECFIAGVDIDLTAAWAITQGSPDVLIVVMDSGVDLRHPDLKDQLYPQGDEDWNFASATSKVPQDNYGHGTAVAGLALAEAGNGIGMAGVAPRCRLIPLKIDGPGTGANILAAFDYIADFAARHPELRLVINASLGVGIDSTSLHQAVIHAYQAGVVICCAAGNLGGDVGVPAIYPETIAVGAIGPDGRRKREDSCDGGAWESAHGSRLDVVAPGVLLTTTDILGPPGFGPGDYLSNFGGTSGATPLVAGVAALMLSANRELTPDRVREIIEATAVDGQGDPDEDRPGFDEFMGWGRVDAGQAVALAAAGWVPRRGDADCNSSLDLNDVLALLAYLFEGARSRCPPTLDSNGDGRVNLVDGIFLIQWLYRGGASPPPLFSS